MQIRLLIVVEPDTPGFHAYSPTLPGLHVPGDTEDEALENAVEAAMCYLESVLKHGDPLPASYTGPVAQGVRRGERDPERRECVRNLVLASP